MAKTSKEIRQSINLFTTNRDTLRDLAHTILVDILLHAAPTGTHVDAGGSADATLALAMLKEMPKSWAEQARAWFDSFSPIRAIPQRDKAGLADKYKAEKDLDQKALWWKIEEAKETPFYKVMEEPAPKMYGLDFIEGIFDAQIKVIEKKLSEGKIKEEAIPAAKVMVVRLRLAKEMKVEAIAEAEPNIAEPLAAIVEQMAA